MKDKEDIKKQLLTSKDIEEIFGISRMTVWRHARNGIFNKIKVGRRIYFRLEDIKKIINKN